MAKNVTLESADLKVVVEHGERTERERARATAGALLGSAAGPLQVNRLVAALGLFGIERDVARGAVKDLVGDGQVAISNGFVQAS